MIFFSVSAALLLVGVLAFLLWPLLKKRDEAMPSRAEYDISVFSQQLQEVEEDLESGLLTKTEADAARIEVQRRMLKSAETDSGVVSRQFGGVFPVAVSLIIFVPAVAISFYFYVGAIGLPDQPFAAREKAPTAESSGGSHAQGQAVGSVEEMIEGLAAKLEQNPADVERWLLLARTLASVQRFDDAALAFDRAMNLTNNHPTIAMHYGELLVNSNNQVVTPKALDIFDAIVKQEPANVRARYYIGLSKSQAGNRKEAIQDWVNLLALSAPEAPWVTGVTNQIKATAEKVGIDASTIKPSTDTLALAKSLPQLNGAGTKPAPQPAQETEETVEDRKEFILTMVKRLAERLKEEPDDLEGWERLATSYEVLGDQQKAAEARAQIARLKGGQ